MIKPRQHIQKARRTLASGHYLLTGDFTEQAGRDAYLAAFHAAQAFIVAQTGKESKSHSGARSEFARLAQHDDRISHSFIAFLGRAYDATEALRPNRSRSSRRRLEMTDLR